MKFGKKLVIFIVIFLLGCAGLVILFDPFYHYHKPLPGLKAVLTEKEYQVVGTLKHFDYDAVIAGSSVAENNNNGWFDGAFDCKTIKAIRSYGATADLCYFLDIAFAKQDLKYVFYNLDPSALSANPHTTFQEAGLPLYLYDDNFLNDAPYLWNKDVLFQRIPYMLAHSLTGDYDEKDSYNWAKWKEFNSDMILGLYIRKKNVAPMKEKTYYQDLLDANLTLLQEQIEAHTDTQFYIFIPPYSMIWWDNIYREGDLDSYLHNMEQAMMTLTAYPNVKLYCFLQDREIVTNLENYMDVLHFSPEVNAYICENLQTDRFWVKKEDIPIVIQEMSTLAEDVQNTLLVPYLDRIKVDIYD